MVSHFIHANSIRLNYLDSGGSGHPLILIHGICDNAHIFEDLIRLLHPAFRVIAYSRRGHGASDAPVTGPYDLATLVQDLKEFMDNLNIERAHLLGWSMGGNEITMFAGDYPERVGKLIYLDSGYDWTDPTFLKTFGEILSRYVPDSSALSSLDAYRMWYGNFWFGDIPWTTALENYLRNATRVGSDGRVSSIPTDYIFEPLFASLTDPPRNYHKVRSAALALYAGIFYPKGQSDPERAEQLNQWEQTVMIPFRRASKERIQRELKNVTIKDLPEICHMSIGVYRTESLAATIREFLLKT